MPYIFSTNSNSAKYNITTKPKDGGPVEVIREVLIKGGATVAAGRGLQTPHGVATQVTQDELDFLLANPTFKRHVERGHLLVSKDKADPDKVAKNMTPHDKSSPQMVTQKATKETAKDIKDKVASKVAE